MKRAASAAAYLLIAFLASYYFTNLWFELNWEFRGAPWGELLRGAAQTPFQYRALVPWIVRAASRFVPGSAVLFWIQCGSLFLLVPVFSLYLACVFPTRLSRVLSFSLFLVLPYNFLLDRFLALRYPSDFPSLLFFTAGLLLLRRRRWGWFYPIIALATLNRETTIFLTAVYLLAAWGSEPRRTVAWHLRLQLFLWASAKFLLWAIYRSNPGESLFQGHVAQNIAFLMDPRAWPLFFSNLGYLWIPVLVWRRLVPDDFVRRSALVVYPFFLAMFFVGNMYELRIYGELIPVVLPAFFLLVRRLAEGGA